MMAPDHASLLSGDLDSALARLFQVPLDDYVTERNSLAGALKKAGRKDEAAFVKALAKPPASAWAVNQIWWRGRPICDALLKAGACLREAQQASLGGRSAELRRAVEQRQLAVDAAVEFAVEALGGPSTVSLPTRQRIAATCDALAVAGATSEARPGYLTADIASPGLAALDGLRAAAEKSLADLPNGPATTDPDRHVELRERRAADDDRAEADRAAREALAAAENRLRTAGDRLSRATAAAEFAAREASRTDARIGELEQALALARGEAAAARSAAETREQELASARADHVAATQALDLAKGQRPRAKG